MKILLFSLSNHFTFQETALNLKKYIENNTQHVVAVITGSNKTFESESENVHRVNYNYKTLNLLHHFKSFKKIMHIINEFKPTHIVFINSHPINYYISKKYLKKSSVFNIIHDVLPHKGDRNDKLVKFYNRRIARVSDYIIVHSSSFVDLFADVYNYPKQKVLFTRLWREYGEYQEIKETQTCLFFGRVNPYKGMNNVYEVAKLLPNVNFNIMGKWDKSMESYKEDLNRLDNINIIDNTVSMFEMEKYFYESELVIIPYESATQSGVIIDSYKYSRPVVTFDVGGLSEQVIDDITGYLVKKNDVHAFSDKIRSHLIKSKELKHKMSLDAWNYGRQEYSTQIGYKRLLDIMEMGEKKY